MESKKRAAKEAGRSEGSARPRRLRADSDPPTLAVVVVVVVAGVGVVVVVVVVVVVPCTTSLAVIRADTDTGPGNQLAGGLVAALAVVGAFQRAVHVAGGVLEDALRIGTA